MAANQGSHQKEVLTSTRKVSTYTRRDITLITPDIYTVAQIPDTAFPSFPISRFPHIRDAQDRFVYASCILGDPRVQERYPCCCSSMEAERSAIRDKSKAKRQRLIDQSQGISPSQHSEAPLSKAKKQRLIDQSQGISPAQPSKGAGKSPQGEQSKGRDRPSQAKPNPPKDVKALKQKQAGTAGQAKAHGNGKAGKAEGKPSQGVMKKGKK
eukprot:gene29661-5079_t